MKKFGLIAIARQKASVNTPTIKYLSVTMFGDITTMCFIPYPKRFATYGVTNCVVALTV
ncbi:MAG: hypothetical protein ACREBB_02995 [Nitrosotalea sp.]